MPTRRDKAGAQSLSEARETRNIRTYVDRKLFS